MAERALVVIPTYNERVNLPLIVPQILQQDPRLEVLVVDDNSPDGTGQLADELAAAEPRIHVLHRPGKAGLGKAYLAGFRWALDRGYDLIFEMDADFSHDPKFLPEFLRAIERRRPGDRLALSVRASTSSTGRSRGCCSRSGANEYARRITGLPLTDSTGGFKCFRRRVLEAIDLDRVRSNGYSFQIEMSFRAWKKGFRLVEIPIVFTDRVEGQSKMNKRIVREAIWMVWWLRLQSWRGGCEGHDRLQDDGSGNDFVILDGRSTEPDEWSAARIVAALRPADRGRRRRAGHAHARGPGRGAHGLSGTPTAPAPPCAAMRRSAAPGSRCYLELVEPGELCLLTDAGVVRARCMPAERPGRDPAAGLRAAGCRPGVRAGGRASAGWPSPPWACRIWSLRVDDIEAIDLLGRGRSLRYDRGSAPAGANVNFVGARTGPGEPWLIRTYERGVEGETLACGTGTGGCGGGAGGRAARRASGPVHQPGGRGAPGPGGL